MTNTRIVSLVKGLGRKQNVIRSLEMIASDLHELNGAQNILIKPNLTDIKNQTANTHVEAVEGVIEFLQTNFPGRQITVGESSGSAFYRKLSTEDVFRYFNYDELEKKYSNIRLESFDNHAEYIHVPIKTAVGITHLRVAERYRDFDCKISVAPPKTHNFAIATLGIKNMAGFVKPQDMSTMHGMKGGTEADAPKTIFDKLPAGTISYMRRNLPNRLVNYLFRHFRTYIKSVKVIHWNILSVSKVVWPDLVVIDGMTGMEGDGPIDGNPVDLGIAIASADALKADGIAARVMGLEPESIGYLFYMQREGMGDYSTDGLVGESIDDVKRIFKLHGCYDVQKEWKD
jgi:uncharacterized protein (DUF362 family)